ncbi:MAG: hypothetical protein WCS18_11765 [Sphaerochaetaceae bacterium]
MHISHTNSKLGADIPSVNLPAGKTCRADAPCRKGCYAMKGNFVYKNVRKSLQDNLDCFLKDPDGFFDEIADGTKLARFVRWHSSGDIVNARYFEGMVSVAERNGKTEYLCFTKKFDIVNSYIDGGGRIPRNLHMVFSGWGAHFQVINPHNFPTTWVMFKDESENGMIPKTAIPCAGHCENCLACWQLRKGQSVFFKKH